MNELSYMSLSQYQPFDVGVKYSLVMAELDSKLKTDVKLLVRCRNALGRFVATLEIRCGDCAIG